MKIERFFDEYRFLSNFWPAEVLLHGLKFPTVENAYQAAKAEFPSQRLIFTHIKPAEAKDLGRRIVMIKDWEEKKLGVMENLVMQKFIRHEHLAQLLKETGDAELIEGNTWNDTFWGVCKGVGENHLGKILMKVRSEL